MKDDKQKKGFFSRLFGKKEKSYQPSTKSDVLRSYVNGRIIPTGYQDEYYTNFISKTYKTTYKTVGTGVSGQFIAHYHPKSKLLLVTLPVFFYNPEISRTATSMNFKESALFMKTIRETWSNKYHFRTKIHNDAEVSIYNSWEDLNDVSVKVQVMSTENTDLAFFRILNSGTNLFKQQGPVLDGYKIPNQYQLPQHAYRETLRSEIERRKTPDTTTTFNQYAYLAGRMFGLGGENSISSALETLKRDERHEEERNKTGEKRTFSKPTLSIYNPQNNKFTAVTYNQYFQINNSFYIIKKGEFYRRTSSGLQPIDSKAPELRGCIGTSTFNLSLTFLGRKHAINNATLNAEKSKNEGSIMAGGRIVEKRHYVHFLHALIKAIQESYPDKNLQGKQGYAPNITHDWKIVD